MNIIQILLAEDWMGVHPLIDVAKGKHEIPQTKEDKQIQKQRKQSWQ